MSYSFTQKIKFALALGAALVLGLTLHPANVSAWTSARVASVDVTLDLAKEGPSKVRTQVRYNVNGGKFHGFDLAPLPGAVLLPEASLVTLDDGKSHSLIARPLDDGRTRITLADKAHVNKGGVTFELVHTLDLETHGALFRRDGTARLDWTPILWNDGLNMMTVTVNLPGTPSGASATVDPDLSKNYEVHVDGNTVKITKFRPVKWYAMRIVMDFDPALVPTLTAGLTVDAAPEMEVAAAAIAPSAVSDMPGPIALLPAAAVLLCLILLVVKVAHVRRVHRYLGVKETFFLLDATALPIRLLLAFGAGALGVWAQYMGSVAAGIPALVAAASLLMVRSTLRETTVKAGGTWRQMSDDDLAGYRRIVRMYKRVRRSAIDITTPGGVISFGLLLAGLAYVVVLTKEEWNTICWATVIDSLIMGIPAWFSNVNRELPVDSTVEGFNVLRKWRKSLSKLVGAHNPNATAQFWVREDKNGPLEVRLRVDAPLSGLNGIEVAGEVLTSSGMHRTRTAVVLRVEPGTETARRLATCVHAVEHHLTPDLEEEIIVLRNRRGRKLGLAPLRAALASL